MKRRWNLIIWLGFLIVLAAPVAYLTVFVDIPMTRDVPWATLVMFGLGIGLMARGVVRAWREPHAYRGRIAGSILLTLGVAFLVLFAYGIFVDARRMPSSPGAPRIGQRAPEFSLPDQDDRPVTLAELLAPDAQGALLIFYRGYW